MIKVSNFIELSNWAKVIGQNLHYSALTNNKAGIVLILEAIKDRKYYIMLKTTKQFFNLPIDTCSIGSATY